jgi:hypothetical protein
MRPKRWSRLTLIAAIAALTAVVLPAAPAGAEAGYEQRNNILIRNNAEFTRANGVRSGSGTAADPYVISGWQLPRLEIRDTSAHVVLRDNYVTSQMILNWIGPHVVAANNVVNDLRVNQNVKRTGAATAGVIRNNRFGVVGQLRHFDGVFSNNRVDRRDGMFDVVNQTFGGLPRAVNFDGWNGSLFTRNVIRGGYVEVRLHGHHHGSGFGDDSHHHGSMYSGDEMDHSKRFHEVWIKDNTIEVESGPALIYTDTAHAANDRTAASEENEALNGKHIHSTRAHLVGNNLKGGGVEVQIFNATDRNHIGTKRGTLEIADNEIVLARPEGRFFHRVPAGINLRDAVDVDLRIEHNRMIGPPSPEGPVDNLTQPSSSTGIRIDRIDKADIYLFDNRIESVAFGLELYGFGKDVRWHTEKLVLRDVERRTQTDGSTEGP